jgi:hypothetical protein
MSLPFEIKITIRDDEEMKAVRVFKLDRDRAEKRAIYFFDTQALRLFGKGLILRARQVKEGDDDSTVKIRPIDPARIDASWNDESGFKLEADAVGAKVVRSASLSHKQKHGEIKDVVSGKRALPTLYSKAQERLLASFAPAPVDFDGLKALGPVAALRWKIDVPGIGSDIAAEEWRLPDGQDLLELSIRADGDKAEAERVKFLRILREAGIDTNGTQEAKTRAALKFFAAKL